MKRSLTIGVLCASAIMLAAVSLTFVLRESTSDSVTSWETSRSHPKSERVYESRGAEHCGLQDTTFLYLNGIGYARDVTGKLARYTPVPFEAGGTLSPDATFTGWHDGQRELWTDPRSDDVGRLSVYIVSPDEVERWPRFGVCF
jgi:hypothetical protein